jgi:CheY-like chemotaxis protein
LEIFKKFRPHLVLTDVSMPIMDGITSARNMRLEEKFWDQSSSSNIQLKEAGSHNEGDRQTSSEAVEGELGEGIGRCKIYAITGLGSSDPRLKMEAMVGEAGLDGWLVKGRDRLDRIRDIVWEIWDKLKSRSEGEIAASC